MMTPQQMEARLIELEAMIKILFAAEIKRKEKENAALQEEIRLRQASSASFGSPARDEDETSDETKRLVAQYNKRHGIR